MAFARRRPPSMEELEEIRFKYEQTGMTIDEIAAEHRMSSSTVLGWARRWSWTPRRHVLPREGPPPRPFPLVAPDAAPAVAGVECGAAPAPSEPGIPDDTPLALRLQRTVERQVAAIETLVAQLGATRPHAGESERAARALATLTRTLRELNALQSQRPEPEADDHSRPDDIDQRRRALARKIDALVAGADGESAGEPEPAGA